MTDTIDDYCFWCGACGVQNVCFNCGYVVGSYPPEVQQAIAKECINKLETLKEVVPLLELCEEDSDKILVWANNHISSESAPRGQDTQEGERS